MATIKEIPAAAARPVSGDISPKLKTMIMDFLEDFGLVPFIKPEYNAKGAFSKAIGGVLKLISAHNGKISCNLNVKPAILNGIGRMHGLAVASVAERVAIACARTVVGNEKELFLEELSISYLSSAPRNAEVVVDGSVVKSGRSVTIVDVSFRIKATGRLLYLSQAKLYNMPLSCL